MYEKFAITILLLIMPFIQGCAVGMIAAGIGAYKYGSAKQQEQYKDYVVEMEKLNFEREKAGLEPKEIPTFKEWEKEKKAEKAEKEEEK